MAVFDAAPAIDLALHFDFCSGSSLGYGQVARDEGKRDKERLCEQYAALECG